MNRLKRLPGTISLGIWASVLLVLATLSLPERYGVAANRYSQIVLPFPSDRVFHYHFNPSENALVLELLGTTMDELSSLDHYDESLIRRLILREKDANTTEIQFVLRDRDIRATITNFKEPFRIIVDLFDRNFSESRDAKSGFPFANQSSGQSQDMSKDKVLGENSVYKPYVKANLPFQFDQQSQQSDSPLQQQQEIIDSQQDQSFDSQGSTGKRRLLQPEIPEFSNSDELAQALQKIPQGRGGAWKKFPPYIYRIQLASLKVGKSYKDFLSKNARDAVTSMDAMASYAASLFDLGHEGQALVAYRQIIHKSPLIFDRDPLQLWRLAEIHLGQGNLTLADGYFQAMTVKHPDHPLAAFAKMRRLDIKALRLLAKGQAEGFDMLLDYLSKIDPHQDKELKAQIAIRQVYWSQAVDVVNLMIKNPYFIPTLAHEQRLILENSYNQVEVEWTGFLVATILLNDNLANKKAWQEQTADIASHYFRNYKGERTEKFSTNLKAKLTRRINEAITEAVASNDYLGAIKVYEKLDTDLKMLPHTAQTSWSLAQAYRLLGQSELATPHYQLASQNLPNGEARFQALFWLTMTLNDVVEESSAKGNTAQHEKYLADRKKADSTLLRAWKELKDDEQSKMLVAFKVPLEMSIRSESLLLSPTKILLEAWSTSLNSKIKDSTSKIDGIKTTYTPTASTVATLTSLASKFKKLGLKKDWEKSRVLLSKLDPKSFDGDKDIEDHWAQNLIDLADSYRQENRYLDAGNIYTLTGSKSLNWQGRAEALYKGGLLLYRAGRKQDALDAFNKASQDGNNLLYSELAKKKLDMLFKN